MRRLAISAIALATAVLPTRALGKPNVNRKGGQWGVLAGASICVPSKSRCKHTDASVLGAGRTRPSFGLGAELGYRWQYFFLGAAYNLGLLRPDYDTTNESPFKNGYQNSGFIVLRPILPLWRFDIGAEIAPGFGRQTFKRKDDEKTYSQGFTFKVGPVVDIFVSRRIFVGLKMDMIVNAHTRTCVQDATTRICQKKRRGDVAGVHQMLFGLHVGGTFP